jgi:hypothetical protein
MARVRGPMGIALGGAGGCGPLPHAGVRPSLRPAQLRVTERPVGAGHFRPVRRGAGADPQVECARRNAAGGLDRVLFVGRVASSTGELCPVGLDPEPEVGERDGREIPCCNSERARASSPSTAARCAAWRSPVFSATCASAAPSKPSTCAS